MNRRYEKDIIIKNIVESFSISIIDAEEVYKSGVISINEDMNLLNKAIIEASYDDIIFAAHSLKGMLLNLGLEYASSIMKDIEYFSKKKDFNKVSFLFQHCADEIGLIYTPSSA